MSFRGVRCASCIWSKRRRRKLRKWCPQFLKRLQWGWCRNFWTSARNGLLNINSNLILKVFGTVWSTNSRVFWGRKLALSGWASWRILSRHRSTMKWDARSNASFSLSPSAVAVRGTRYSILWWCFSRSKLFAYCTKRRVEASEKQKLSKPTVKI